MMVIGLILALVAIGIFMYAEEAMIDVFGFIIGIVGVYIMLKYRPKNRGLKKGRHP